MGSYMEKTQITSIWYESDEWAEPYDENDSNMDVIFALSDGTKWIVTFFTYQNILSLSRKNKTTGECLKGLYFCATDMVLIETLTKDNVVNVLNEMIRENEISTYCTPLENDVGA